VWNESAGTGFAPLLPDGHQLPEIETGLFEELLANPDLSVLVSDEDGEVVGYTGCGASRDTDTRAEVGEVRSMFVAPRAWRTGVGRALMEAALDDLRARGYTEAIVWSFADNEPANRLYESAGFTRDGAERTEERWAHVREVRYRRTLG
jgi:GNAT superfamily N-acetyltransferase